MADPRRGRTAAPRTALLLAFAALTVGCATEEPPWESIRNDKAGYEACRNVIALADEIKERDGGQMAVTLLAPPERQQFQVAALPAARSDAPGMSEAGAELVNRTDGEMIDWSDALLQFYETCDALAEPDVYR